MSSKSWAAHFRLHVTIVAQTAPVAQQTGAGGLASIRAHAKACNKKKTGLQRLFFDPTVKLCASQIIRRTQILRWIRIVLHIAILTRRVWILLRCRRVRVVPFLFTPKSLGMKTFILINCAYFSVKEIQFFGVNSGRILLSQAWWRIRIQRTLTVVRRSRIWILSSRHLVVRILAGASWVRAARVWVLTVIRVPVGDVPSHSSISHHSRNLRKFVSWKKKQDTNE
jgi:hypothetical protein